MNQIYGIDNLKLLHGIPDTLIDLVYTDPPWNTGKVQKRTQIKTNKNEDGDRIGFQGKKYKTTKLATTSFDDNFKDFIEFLTPRVKQIYRILKPNGSFFLHMGWKEAAYCQVMLDKIFGRECFMNQIIWAYDYGARSKSKWSNKHDIILWYVKDPKNYTFNYDRIDRIPYLAPDLVGKEKAKIGKTPTTVWWNTIVPTNGKEKTGYATQKPLAILNRIVLVHSNPGDQLLDPFAGSGSFGEAAFKHNRQSILIDSNTEAVKIMTKRLPNHEVFREVA